MLRGGGWPRPLSSAKRQAVILPPDVRVPVAALLPAIGEMIDSSSIGAQAA